MKMQRLENNELVRFIRSRKKGLDLESIKTKTSTFLGRREVSSIEIVKNGKTYIVNANDTRYNATIKLDEEILLDIPNNPNENTDLEKVLNEILNKIKEL